MWSLWEYRGRSSQLHLQVPRKKKWHSIQGSEGAREGIPLDGRESCTKLEKCVQR